MSWLRRAGLTVTAGGNALDLSQMQFKFQTTQMDVEGGYPPSTVIRVYNLSDETAKKVQKEYSDVILQAGYVDGDYGVIFKGTIKMIRRGRESQVDSYLEIIAADGDTARYAICNFTSSAGWKAADVAKRLSGTTEKFGVTVDPAGFENANATGGVVGIRGKVSWGLSFSRANDLAQANYGSFSIIDGKMVFTPLQGYRDGEIVKLNSNTGLISIPESTIQGIEAICLLNPKLRIGGRVQINNADINQTTVKEPGYPRFGDRPYFASVTADGIYRALVIEHTGDTRGQEWYSQLTCLALDPTAKPADAVAAYGDAGVPARASGATE